MPSLQQFTPNDCTASSMRPLTDILQKHSINSILEQRQDFLNRQNEATDELITSMTDPIAITDFLGLGKHSNNETLMLGGGSKMDPLASSISAYTPLTPSSTQSLSSPCTLFSPNSYDVFQFENVAHNTPLKVFQRNISFDCSAPLSPSTPTSIYNRSFHSSPLVSDSSTSSSGNGLSVDSSVRFSSSRSNSPESQNSAQSNSEQSFIDMMNLLSVSAEQQYQTPYQQQQQQQQQHQQQMGSKKYQNQPSAPQANFFDDQLFTRYDGGISAVDIELARLQNMQALSALKLLQSKTQPIPLLNHLLQGYNNLNQLQLKSWQMPQSGTANNDAHLDRVAKFHRSSAALYDATCTWSGQLPPRSHRMTNYSPKVFLGGIPWDISEQSLIQIFKPFGQIRVEWPGKEQQAAPPKGYVYIIFESDKQVKALLSACALQADDSHSGSIYYFKISSRRIKAKDVEVIPWIIADSNYVKSTSQKLDPTKTIFVGALHGKLTAEGLAKIMDDLFDGVVYAGIDTDKYKYPIGSGRVTFNNNRSYMRAVSAAFIEIRTIKFTKKVQVQPYLEDSLCSVCGVQHGPYYCRELSCFRYFCRTCWLWQHATDGIQEHIPLTRNPKSQMLVGIGPASSTTSLASLNSAPPPQQQQQTQLPMNGAQNQQHYQQHNQQQHQPQQQSQMYHQSLFQQQAV